MTTLTDLSTHLQKKAQEKADAEKGVDKQLENHRVEYVEAMKYLCEKIDSLTAANAKIEERLNNQPKCGCTDKNPKETKASA